MFKTWASDKEKNCPGFIFVNIRCLDCVHLDLSPIIPILAGQYAFAENAHPLSGLYVSCPWTFSSAFSLCVSVLSESPEGKDYASFSCVLPGYENAAAGRRFRVSEGAFPRIESQERSSFHCPQRECFKAGCRHSFPAGPFSQGEECAGAWHLPGVFCNLPCQWCSRGQSLEH